MADCNNCSSYLSSEDIIRRSVKCSGGSVAFIGSNVNPFLDFYIATNSEDGLPVENITTNSEDGTVDLLTIDTEDR